MHASSHVPIPCCHLTPSALCSFLTSDDLKMALSVMLCIAGNKMSQRHMYLQTLRRASAGKPQNGCIDLGAAGLSMSVKAQRQTLLGRFPAMEHVADKFCRPSSNAKAVIRSPKSKQLQTRQDDSLLSLLGMSSLVTMQTRPATAL